jgi:hypothetical protein
MTDGSPRLAAAVELEALLSIMRHTPHCCDFGREELESESRSLWDLRTAIFEQLKPSGLA